MPNSLLRKLAALHHKEVGMTQLEQLLADMREEFPGLRIVKKTTWFWRLLGVLVTIFTFGKNRRFVTGYATTIGKVIAVPPDWALPPETVDPEDGFSEWGMINILRHERVHLRQQRRLGFGFIWLGMIPYSIIWLFLPLPVGLAYGRYRLEREAFVETIKANIDMVEWLNDSPLFSDGARSSAIDHAVAQTVGPNYGYMWPFEKQVRAFYEAAVPPKKHIGFAL